MDEILLKVKTPEFDLGAIDAAIKRLEKLDALCAKPRTVKIDVQMNDAIERVQKQMDGLKASAASAAAPIKQTNTYLASLMHHLRRLPGMEGDVQRIGRGFRDAAEEVEYFEKLSGRLAKSRKSLGFSFDRVNATEMADSIANAQNMISLRMEEIFQKKSAEIEKEQNKKLFQSPEERRGAAKGKAATDDLTKAEKKLAPAAESSEKALAGQDAALLAKIKTLHGATQATNRLAASEQKLAGNAGDVRGALIRKTDVTTASGETFAASRVYQSAPGITHTVRPDAEGDTISTLTNRMQQLQQRARALNDEAATTIARRKGEGASAREISGLYQKLGTDLDALARRYEDIETVSGRLVAAQAQRARNRGSAEMAAANIRGEQQMLAQASRDWKAMRARIEDDARRNRAENLIGGFEERGFTKAGERTTRTAGGGSRHTVDFSRENETMRENHRLVVDRDRAGRVLNATVTESSRVFKQSGYAVADLSKNFLRNTAHITLWATSVGALYGSLAILRSGLEAAVRYDRKFATLSVVFRGSADEAARLRDEALALAVAYGQAGDEALDAAIRFARLGLTQKQTLEAVRASLLAANVAEISVGEAADQLAAIMATFALEAKDLAGVINKLNAISNTYNVTNKDMLTGLGRMGAVARQAGLGLEEAMGAVSAIVARTGRSGAEAGNALKSVIVALSNPALQGKLMEQFQFEVLGANGQLNNMSDILRDLYLAYQQLTDAERQHMLQMIGGKQQASRLAALLDGYIDSQMNAIRSLRTLDSAEQENARIKQSLIVQVQSLATAYERLVYNLGNSGGSVAGIRVLGEAVTFLKNALNLMAQFGDQTAIVVGIMALLSARMAITAYRMASVSKSANFFSNTVKAMNGVVSGVHSTLVRMNREFLIAGSRILGFKAQIVTSTGAMRAFGLTAFWLTGAITTLARAFWPLALATAAMWALNRTADAFTGSWERATQKLAGFNEQLERLRALGDAGRMSARLVQTMIERLGAPNGVSPEDAERFIGAASEIGSGGDNKRRQQLQDELRSSYQQNASLGLRNRLYEILRKLREDNVELSEKENKAQREAIEQARENVRIQSGREKPDEAKLAEARKELAKLQGQQARAIMDMEDEDGSAPSGPSPADRRANEAQKILESRLASVNKAYDTLTKVSASDENRVQVIALQEQLAALEKFNAERRRGIDLEIENSRAATASARARLGGFTRYNKVVRGIEEAEGALFMASRNAPKPNYNSDYSQILNLDEVEQWGARMQSIRANLEKLRAEQKALEKNTGVLSVKADFEKATATQRELEETRAGSIATHDALIAKQREELELSIKQREEEQRLAEIMDAISRGRRFGQMAPTDLQYGSETERILREQARFRRGAAERDAISGMALNPAASRSDLARARRSGDPAAEAQAIEELRTMVSRYIDNENRLTERRLTLTAMIREEERRIGQERSRNLLMADREGQLRAAMAEKFARQRGRGFSAEEFAFLGQETKQAIAQTNENLLPPQARTELAALNEELALNARHSRSYTEALQEQREIIEKLIEQTRPGGGGQPGQQPGIQLNIDSVLASLDSAGGAVQSALQNLGNSFVAQFERIELVVRGIESRVGTLGTEFPVSNAQGSARVTN